MFQSTNNEKQRQIRPKQSLKHTRRSWAHVKNSNITKQRTRKRIKKEDAKPTHTKQQYQEITKNNDQHITHHST